MNDHEQLLQQRGERTVSRRGFVAGTTALIAATALGRFPQSAVGAADLRDGGAMRHRLDAVALGRRALQDRLAVLHLDDAGEHQMRVGVFVIDEQQPVRGRIGRALHRHVADEIVVVTELFRLSLGRLLGGIEFRRIREQPIAPAQQDLRVVAFGDVVVGIDADLDLLEVEGRFRALRLGFAGRLQRQRADRGRDRRDRERALQQPATRKALRDQLAHGGIVGRVHRRGVVMLQHARAEGGFVVGLVGHASAPRPASFDEFEAAT